MGETPCRVPTVTGVSLEGSRELMKVSAQIKVAEEEGQHGCGVREYKEWTSD